MKFNKWTLGLAAGGVVSLASAAQADEAKPMSQVQTAVSATTLSGYVDTSIIWKPGTGDANLPGRQYDGTSNGANKLDGFNLNVIGLTLEKPLSEDQWASGYKADLWFGPDAGTYRALVGNVGGDPNFAVKQAYVALRTPVGNGIDWKAGVFDTIIGYESSESYLNPNYSRSFGHGLEPKQHTGVLATYKATDAVSFSAGIANTYNNVGVDNVNARPVRAGGPTTESEKTYLASISITAPDSWGFLKGSAWYAGIIDGLAGNSKDTTSAYIGGSLNTPVEGLSVGGAFDYRWDGASANGVVFQPGTSWAYAIAGYASFQANEKWKFNARLDYTEGSDGAFYDRSTLTPAGVNLGPDNVKNRDNRLGAVTLTADYALWANVVSRAELRWDHSMSGDKPYGGTTVPNQRNAVTLALNLIYKF